jgi:hypothetical protein
MNSRDDKHGMRKTPRKKDRRRLILVCLPILLAAVVMLACNNQVRALLIRPGMSPRTVVAIMGTPEEVLGPTEGARYDEMAYYFYPTMGDRLVEVRFRGNRVHDPPVEVRSRSEFEEQM